MFGSSAVAIGVARVSPRGRRRCHGSGVPVGFHPIRRQGGQRARALEGNGASGRRRRCARRDWTTIPRSEAARATCSTASSGACSCSRRPSSSTSRTARWRRLFRFISTRSGMPLVLDPDENDRWSSARITLAAEKPVPFWTAVDRLCSGRPPQAVGRVWGQLRRPGTWGARRAFSCSTQATARVRLPRRLIPDRSASRSSACTISATACSTRSLASSTSQAPVSNFKPGSRCSASLGS